VARRRCRTLLGRAPTRDPRRGRWRSLARRGGGRTAHVSRGRRELPI